MPDVSVSKPPPVPKIPRKWKRDRIEATHMICNGTVKGDRKIVIDIPRFACGWRHVRLEKESKNYAHIIECGTGARARVDLDVWRDLVKKGKALNDQA